MGLAINISGKKRKSLQRKRWVPYLLVSPYLVFVLLFVLFPVLFCFFLTFNKWNIISPMKFIGVDNYSRLFQDRLFWKAIGNTLKFLLLHIPLQLAVSLFLAYLLDNYVLLVPNTEHYNDERNVPIYFSLIAIGGGLGLFASYKIEKKWYDENKKPS